MPIYEYRCTTGHTFETFQSMSDEPVDICEFCEEPVERVLSAPAIHFKGSGFYTTDYAKKGAAKPAGENGSSKSESSGDSDSGSSADSKSDSGAKSDSDSKSDSGAKSKSKSSSE